MHSSKVRRWTAVCLLAIGMGAAAGCRSTVPATVDEGYGEYLLVAAGEFVMGDDSEAALPAEGPAHTVRLDAYYIGKYEVTNGEYRKFVDDGGYADEAYWTEGGFGGYGTEPKYWNDADHRGGGIDGNRDFPVVGVSWYEAAAYCRWLSEKTSQTYRLPTEAEWERAARGTDGRQFPWGDSIDGSYANFFPSGDPYEDDSMRLGGFTPVGFYDGGTHEGFATHDNASPYGAYDMAGNVFEWVSDLYDENYYAVAPTENPAGPSTGAYTSPGAASPQTGDIGTVRGGFWTDNDGETIMESLRVTFRSPVTEGRGHQQHRTGFRCVREAG
jgi:formylglycine-generating enzyme required for sulfatase activity